MKTLTAQPTYSGGRSAGALSLITGTANHALGEAVASALGVSLSPAQVQHFPDGEQHVELLESVRGSDVFIVQPTSPPVDQHLIELLLLCDAARRAGADRVTAVVPYFGYARQDRRTHGREPLAARLAADAIAITRVDRVVAVDVHGRGIEGFFSVAFEQLAATPFLLKRLIQDKLPEESVVVSPDFGAVKLAEYYARELDLPMAVVRKTRISGTAVKVSGVTGDVRNRVPIIVDDMISTGATIKAASDALMHSGALPGATVVATHGLFVGEAADNLCGEWLKRVIVTDTVHQEAGTCIPLDEVPVSALLADAIGRLHRRESLDGLISYG
jgi:ribose-phosphate pyrophosphokinase